MWRHAGLIAGHVVASTFIIGTTQADAITDVPAIVFTGASPVPIAVVATGEFDVSTFDPQAFVLNTNCGPFAGSACDLLIPDLVSNPPQILVHLTRSEERQRCRGPAYRIGR